MRILIPALISLFYCSAAGAQDRGVYVIGALSAHVQPHSTSSGEPLGGTTWGPSATIGTSVSSRVLVEFESLFSGAYSGSYSYSPKIGTVNVVAERRDTFLSGQLRTHVATAFEPIIGVAYVIERMSRHATFASGGSSYFDDSRTDRGFAAVLGLDVPARVGAHFDLVPAFRLLVVSKRSYDSDPSYDALLADTSTGRVVFRIGAGGRVRF